MSDHDMDSASIPVPLQTKPTIVEWAKDNAGFEGVSDERTQPKPTEWTTGELCNWCGKLMNAHTHCPFCGYTECDKEIHGDHYLCDRAALAKVKEGK